MKLKLSKSIAEIENDNIKHIWEPPDIYDDVHKDNIWLIYGRKGAGKSTVIDYLGIENAFPNVIICRPGQTKQFATLRAAASRSEGEDRIVEQNMVAAIDFAMTVLILEKVVANHGVIRPGSPREKIRDFLTQNNLGGGYGLLKTITFIRKLMGNKFRFAPDFASQLDAAISGVSIEEAKDALCSYLKELNKTFVLCIDDIDEIGFSYSRSDRLFINALIVFMVHSNIFFQGKKAGGRVLLTSPSELFFQSSLWGSDWVSSKSKCLSWTNTSHLQDLVNKRIAVEMNIRKKNPRFKDDKFSIETEQTWRRIFPMNIQNKRGRSESAFEYIVRHTFYTPRQVLDLCDAILLNADYLVDASEQTTPSYNQEWSKVFQDSVGNFAQRVERDVKTMFSAIYDGVDETLKAFVGRPNVWNKSQLASYVLESKLKLIRKHDQKVIEGEDLIHELQQIGFMGLGTRSLNPGPPDVETYTMFFSFLEDYPSRKAWELAAITPLFYDAYDIRAVDHIVVKPHEKLTLTPSALRKVRTYDHRRNVSVE